jgi:hypothetical protein
MTTKRQTNNQLATELDQMRAANAQLAEQVALLLAMQSRSAENSPAPAPKTGRRTAPAAPAAPAAPEHVRWIDMALGSKKPWTKSDKFTCKCARRALITGDNRPILDITASLYNQARGCSTGAEIPEAYIKDWALVDMLTHAQLRANDLTVEGGIIKYNPK